MKFSCTLAGVHAGTCWEALFSAAHEEAIAKSPATSPGSTDHAPGNAACKASRFLASCSPPCHHCSPHMASPPSSLPSAKPASSNNGPVDLWEDGKQSRSKSPPSTCELGKQLIKLASSEYQVCHWMREREGDNQLGQKSEAFLRCHCCASMHGSTWLAQCCSP